MRSTKDTQRLDWFRLPDNFRGRSKLYVQCWWLVQALAFKWLPQICYPVRRALLRAFGANIGTGVKIRPGVEVTFPWKVKIGNYAWIGDDVTLYSLGSISVGEHTVISQNCYLCAADHDYSKVDFPIRERPISIGNEVWVAGDVWIGPGVTVGDKSVVGARSTVTGNLPAGMVCLGTPCRPIKARTTTATAN